MILEAMKYMKSCPDGFVVQAAFDDLSFSKRFIPKVPILGKFAIKRSLGNGEIFLRPAKVDNSKPTFYVLEGWHVRNLSQRQDPISNGDGSVHLKYSRMRLKNR